MGIVGGDHVEARVHMASAVETLFAELQWFFEPLSLALESPQDFAAFVRRFGFALDDEDVAGALDGLAGLRDGALSLAEVTEDAVTDGFDAADVIAVATAAAPLFQGLGTLRQSLGALPAPEGLTANEAQNGT